MRQPDFSSSRRPSRAPAWERVAVAACALVALTAAALSYHAREEARAAAGRLSAVSREVDTAKVRVAAARERASGATALAAEDAPPARIVAEIAALLPDAARLERLEIDYRRGGLLELAVVARDAAAWDLLLQRLEATPHLREVQPGPESRADEVRSTLRARWGAGPEAGEAR